MTCLFRHTNTNGMTIFGVYLSTFLLFILSVCCLLVPLSGYAQVQTQTVDDRLPDHIEIRETSLLETSTPRVFAVNLRFHYQLTDYLREGLLNGMTLQHQVHFELHGHNNWWWNSAKPVTVLESELKYHALSEHYQVVRLDTGENWNFPNLPSALNHLGTLQQYRLPALPEQAFGNHSSLYVYATLQPKSPSLPLNLQTFFGNRHKLTSQSVLWHLD